MRSMSPHAARRLLWLAALLIVPLPMLVFDAVVPVARYLLLAGLCVGMVIAEGPGGVVWQLAALFVSHALVYAALLYLLAWAIARALARTSARARAAAVAVAVAACLVWAIATQPYVTPFGRAAHANLLGVLQ
jgi:hypothetical protein